MPWVQMKMITITIIKITKTFSPKQVGVGIDKPHKPKIRDEIRVKKNGKTKDDKNQIKKAKIIYAKSKK
jgi:hypothetical protein